MFSYNYIHKAFKFSLLRVLEGTEYSKSRETEGQLKHKKEYHIDSRNNSRSSDAERLHTLHHNLLYP